MRRVSGVLCESVSGGGLKDVVFGGRARRWTADGNGWVGLACRASSWGLVRTRNSRTVEPGFSTRSWRWQGQVWKGVRPRRVWAVEGRQRVRRWGMWDIVAEGK